MNVLVTRPKHQSEQLIRALESHGHQPQSLPLLEVSAKVLSDEQKKNILEKLQAADKVIAVSANAAMLALPHLADAEITEKQPLFAIGPSTAGVLKEKGYSVSIPKSEYNSENLLALDAFSQVAGQNIALLCGKGGRDYLELQLSERRAKVERIELYERIPIADHGSIPDMLDTPEVLTAMSGDTAEALGAFLANYELTSWKSLPLIVPGRRVADIALQQGFSNVLMTQKPTTESLLEAIGSIE